MKIFIASISILLGINGIAQTQIGNSDFESWENVSGGQEPVNWNSFLTASGFYSSFAADQCVSSTDIRPCSPGAKSCKINSRDAGFAIANGNVTLGQVNMGSATPTNSANYNSSITSDGNFSEAITDSPDSIVFWVKFIPNGHNQNARMKATLHDAYNYKDPEDATSSSHVVATAELNYTKTNGAWVRKSVPFTYSGPASTVEYILVTFTTNETPGGGAANDLVYVDDVELIYNSQAGNGAVVANDDSYSTDMDLAVTCDVLTNDVDPEGQFCNPTLEVTVNPTNGNAVVNSVAGTISYTPNASFTGSDSFEYSICDKGSLQSCDNAVVNININPLGVNEINIHPIVVSILENDIHLIGEYTNYSHYSIYSVSGKKIAEGSVSETIEFNETNGVYFIELIGDAGMQRIKFMKY